MEGYKGNLRKYIAAYSESIFDGDHLRFTDTGSNYVHYTMDLKNRIATTLEDVIPLSQANLYAGKNTIILSLASITNDTPVYQEFLLSLTSGYKLKAGTVKVSINGLEQICNNTQVDDDMVDFYLDNTYSKIRIKKEYIVISGSDMHNAVGKLSGIDLINSDRIDIEYQMETN